MGSETGDRLKKVSEQLFKGNQSEMARMMGMKPQSLNKYYQGDREPGIKVLKRLVSLGVNATWVISGIPPMMISDIKGAGVSGLKASEREVPGKEGEAPDFFSHINEDQLSETERALLAEVKRFSDSLKRFHLPAQVKLLMLELMIEHIDQEIERLRDSDS